MSNECEERTPPTEPVPEPPANLIEMRPWADRLIGGLTDDQAMALADQFGKNTHPARAIRAAMLDRSNPRVLAAVPMPPPPPPPPIEMLTDEIRGSAIVTLFDVPDELPPGQRVESGTTSTYYPRSLIRERLGRAIGAGELVPVEPLTGKWQYGVFKLLAVHDWHRLIGSPWPLTEKAKVWVERLQAAARREIVAVVERAAAAPDPDDPDVFRISDLPPLLALAVRTWRDWWRKKHPDGWPTNEEVEGWLRDQKVEDREVSGREAKAICLIAKPSAAKKGR